MSHCTQVNICTILHNVSAHFNNGWSESNAGRRREEKMVEQERIVESGVGRLRWGSVEALRVHESERSSKAVRCYNNINNRRIRKGAQVRMMSIVIAILISTV